MTYEIEAIDESIILFRFLGYIDDGIAEAFVSDLQPYIDNASPQKPLYLLSGEAATPQASRGARQKFVGIMKNPAIAYIAITQGNPFIKVLTTFIVKAAGRGEVINFFSTEEECLQWLQKQRREREGN